MMNLNTPATRAVIVGLLALALSGCGAVVIGGAVATANVAHDRRTAGTLVEDQRSSSKPSVSAMETKP